MYRQIFLSNKITLSNRFDLLLVSEAEVDIVEIHLRLSSGQVTLL